jgi:hypothetical protein
MSGTRLTWIPAQFVRVATAYRLDLQQYIIGGVWFAPGSTNGVVRLWKVNISDLSNAGEIVFANDAGKDDSVEIEILATGELLITVSEAVPGGSGSTAEPEVYRIPNVFSPFVSPSGSVDQTARNMVTAHITKDHAG